MRIGTRIGLVMLASLGVAAGCETLTRTEAAEALEEAQIATQAAALTSGSVEIATTFTIGDAVEAAAAEIATFVETQLPCAAVTLTGATLRIEYGANPGLCIYRGQTYSGVHTISVMRNEMDAVVVEHTWTELQNQTVSVTGYATVTWSFADQTRRVMHEMTWTRLSDGRMGVGSGDRTQMPLDEGLFSGFAENGSRQWEGDAGTWRLDIEGVEIRWVDAVPQAGLYTLTTPAEKTLSLGFQRADSTTITVTIGNGSQTYDFDVVTLPSDG